MVTLTTFKDTRSYPCRSLESATKLVERFIAGVTKPARPAAAARDHPGTRCRTGGGVSQTSLAPVGDFFLLANRTNPKPLTPAASLTPSRPLRVPRPVPSFGLLLRSLPHPSPIARPPSNPKGGCAQSQPAPDSPMDHVPRAARRDGPRVVVAVLWWHWRPRLRPIRALPKSGHSCAHFLRKWFTINRWNLRRFCGTPVAPN